MVDTTLTFYKTLSDFRTLDKVLGTALGTATGQLHENINDIEMVIMLPGEYLNYCQNANIVYNSTTQKYYFLEIYDIENNLVYAHLKEDVRMSFSQQIKNIYATVNRSASEFQGYLYDSGYELLTYKTAAMRNFPVEINNDNMILTTVG